MRNKTLGFEHVYKDKIDKIMFEIHSICLLIFDVFEILYARIYVVKL